MGNMECKKLVENFFYENAQPAKTEPVNAQQDESQSKDEIPVVLKSEFVFNIFGRLLSVACEHYRVLDTERFKL